MKNLSIIFIFIFTLSSSCTDSTSKDADNGKVDPDIDLVFDKVRWKIKEGDDYPYREKMLHDVVYNDTIRTLDKSGIVDLLGKPDRINENHFYYLIEQKKLLSWPLHTKTMVIKFVNDTTIAWIKIHE